MKQASPVRLALGLMLMLASAYATAGCKVAFVVGEVVRFSEQQPAPQALQRDDVVITGQTLRTGSNGAVQLRCSDGSMLALKANTEFRIDDYRFTGAADGSERGFFSLIKGALRTITGAIGKGARSSYQMRTAVATVGIRGTEYSLQFSGGEDGLLEVHTAAGAVEVSNGGGCMVVAAGGSASVRGGASPAGVGGPVGRCQDMPAVLPERILTPPPPTIPDAGGQQMPQGLTQGRSTAPANSTPGTSPSTGPNTPSRGAR